MTHVSSIDAYIYQSPKAFRVLVIRPSWVGLLTANYGFGIYTGLKLFGS